MQIESPNVEVIDPRYDTVKKTKNTSQADKQNWLEQIAKDESFFIPVCYGANRFPTL